MNQSTQPKLPKEIQEWIAAYADKKRGHTFACYDSMVALYHHLTHSSPLQTSEEMEDKIYEVLTAHKKKEFVTYAGVQEIVKIFNEHLSQFPQPIVSGGRTRTEMVYVDRANGAFKFPRRSCTDQHKPAESAIYKAIQQVEGMDADIRLTNASIKLREAQDLVADFIDEKILKEEWVDAPSSQPTKEGREDLNTSEQFPVASPVASQSPVGSSFHRWDISEIEDVCCKCGIRRRTKALQLYSANVGGYFGKQYEYWVNGEWVKPIGNNLRYCPNGEQEVHGSVANTMHKEQEDDKQKTT